MSELQPCKNLDYEEGKYGPDITLETAAPHFPDVRYWRRGRIWTDGGNPECVQFCGAGRGRINAIFDCYDGSMSCYEPAKEHSARSSSDEASDTR